MSEKSLILEQYKLYIEMADRISARRHQANQFYISIISGLLAVLSIVFKDGGFEGYEPHALLAVSFLGICLNVVWSLNIRYYRQLNTAKFKVVHELEKELPFACYDREWDLLGRGEQGEKYLQLTRVERFVPVLLSLPYFLLLAYVIISMI